MKTGLVLQHNPIAEEDFTGKRVYFDRWSGRPFKLTSSEGKEAEFVQVWESAVMAVFENEEEAGNGNTK